MWPRGIAAQCKIEARQGATVNECISGHIQTHYKSYLPSRPPPPSSHSLLKASPRLLQHCLHLRRRVLAAALRHIEEQPVAAGGVQYQLEFEGVQLLGRRGGAAPLSLQFNSRGQAVRGRAQAS